MQKKNWNSNEEIFAKTYVELFLQVRDSTLSLAEYYSKQSKFLLEKLYKLKENEPFKLFKRTHKEWEQVVDQLETEHETTFNLYMEQCQELEEMMNFVK